MICYTHKETFTFQNVFKYTIERSYNAYAFRKPQKTHNTEISNFFLEAERLKRSRVKRARRKNARSANLRDGFSHSGKRKDPFESFPLRGEIVTRRQRFSIILEEKATAIHMRSTYDRETWLSLRHPDEKDLFFDVGTRSRPSSYCRTCERNGRRARTWRRVEGKSVLLREEWKAARLYREKKRERVVAPPDWQTDQSWVERRSAVLPLDLAPALFLGFPTRAFTQPAHTRSTREVWLYHSRIYLPLGRNWPRWFI